MIYVVLVGMLGAAGYAYNYARRYNHFLEFLSKHSRMSEINSYETFNNYEQSKPWDYNFERMVSYI